MIAIYCSIFLSNGAPLSSVPSSKELQRVSCMHDMGSHNAIVLQLYLDVRACKPPWCIVCNNSTGMKLSSICVPASIFFLLWVTVVYSHVINPPSVETGVISQGNNTVLPLKGPTAPLLSPRLLTPSHYHAAFSSRLEYHSHRSKLLCNLLP